MDAKKSPVVEGVHGGLAHGHIIAGVGAADGLSEEVGEAGAEDGESQAGHVLVGPEGDGEHTVEKRAEGGAEKGQNKPQQHGDDLAGSADLLIEVGSGQTAHGPHKHHTLHAQVQVAGFLGENFAQCTEEKRHARQDGGGEEACQIKITHGAPPPFHGKSAGS